MTALCWQRKGLWLPCAPAPTTGQGPRCFLKGARDPQLSPELQVGHIFCCGGGGAGATGQPPEQGRDSGRRPQRAEALAAL